MDQGELLDRLNALLPAQFDELVFRLGVPAQWLSQGSPQTTKAVEVLQYLTRQGRLEELGRRLHWDRALPAGPAASSATTVTASATAQDALYRPETRVSPLPANHTIVPGVLTVPNNLPARRRFVGRTAELNALFLALMRAPAVSVVQPTSFYGLGGVGKSALALEFCYRKGTLFPRGVWWVRAEGRPAEALARLLPELRRIGPPDVRDLLGRLGQDAPTSEVAEAIRHALQNQPGSSLLVLDNVDSPEWDLMLPGGDVRVIITTRERRCALGESNQLDVLSPSDAITLAEAIAGPVPNEAERAARERVVTERLDGLAIAVDVAARTVRAWKVLWTWYEAKLTNAEPVLRDPDLAKEYPHDVCAVLDLPIERLPVGSPQRRFVEAAALFAAHAVPLDWVMTIADVDLRRVEVEILPALSGSGLLSVEPGRRSVSMHNLFRQRVLVAMVDEQRKSMVRLAAQCVRRWLMDNVDETRIVDVDARCPHVRALLGLLDECDDDATWVDIALSFATHLRYCAEYLAASEIMFAALEHEKRIVPRRSAGLSSCLSNLGAVLVNLDRIAQARAMLEQALATDEEEFGPKHLRVADHMSALATVVLREGNPSAARELLERSLEITVAFCGWEHASVATDLSNLAMIARDLGDLAGARALLKQSLEIIERLFGSSHSKVARRLYNLALVLREQGETLEARRSLERAVAILERNYGPAHPSVVACLVSLSGILETLGDHTAAADCGRRAAAIREGRAGT